MSADDIHPDPEILAIIHDPDRIALDHEERMREAISDYDAAWEAEAEAAWVAEQEAEAAAQEEFEQPEAVFEFINRIALDADGVSCFEDWPGLAEVIEVIEASLYGGTVAARVRFSDGSLGYVDGYWHEFPGTRLDPPDVDVDLSWIVDPA